ncbi:Cysteine-rich receptor-like protein kinase 6 [Hordeum vulgare]|nr:Cysteine-rich receptor-like protein kinase 6 [Hordeum vulgare]
MAAEAGGLRSAAAASGVATAWAQARVAQDRREEAMRTDTASKPAKTMKFAVIITIVIIGFVLLLLLPGFLIWRKVQRNKEATMFDDIMRGECPMYDFEMIRGATGGFCPENEIGRGGFGIVYKGQMQDGQEIAVKKLSTDNRVQGLKEFKNEVDLIARLQHRSLVRLLGCCIHYSDRILIYEYMSNKSLDNFIFDLRRRATLSWKTRMDIILGVARGLLYLHQDSRHTMIHRDLKAANVLLNGEMVAKISDFGIAKLFSNIDDNQDSTVTERIVGTFGYMAPEYAMDGMVSFMQDVYSFGVLLLEIQQVPRRPLRPVVCMPVSTRDDHLNRQEDTSGNFQMIITDLEGR